jgi:hypothetical protein
MRGVFFGLEYDNDAIPNAIVIAGTRSGKFVKWVQEYLPTKITREDGKEVWRERRVIQLPMHYNLRKDEVHGAMKRHKTESWQDGKFFVLESHAIGVHIHPLKAKMEKAEKEKREASVDPELKKELHLAGRVGKPGAVEAIINRELDKEKKDADLDAKRIVNGGDKKPVVAPPSDANKHLGGIKQTS